MYNAMTQQQTFQTQFSFTAQTGSVVLCENCEKVEL